MSSYSKLISNNQAWAWKYWYKTAKNSFDLQLFVNKDVIFLFYPSKIYHLYKWSLKGIVMSRPRSSRWLLNLIKSDLILTPGPRGPGPRCPVASVPAPAPMLPMCVTAAAEIPSPSSVNKSDTHFVSILDSWQTTLLAAGLGLGRSLKTKPLELYFNANKMWGQCKARILGKYHLNFNFS